MKSLKAPYPFFGGKSRVASLVWDRFGDVPNFVEPCFGSGAVLLARPHAPQTETVNDANAFISNFWRAVQSDVEAVAFHCDWPVNEVDLHARHLWLVEHGATHVEKCKADPEYFDAKIAGWWCWGACMWIGSGWCDKPNARIPQMGDSGMGVHRPSQQIPHVSTCGMGVHSPSHQLPHLADAGPGLHRPSQKIPSISGAGSGVHRSLLHQKMPEMGSERGTRSDRASSDLLGYLQSLSDRLRRVRVCCGDWSRVVGDSVTWRHGATGIFLDPPYSLDERQKVYRVDTGTVAADVREWCLANGDNPLLRICLCGYAGEGHEPLEAAGWTCVAWKAAGGYGSQGDGRGRANAKRERLWFSPHCLSQGMFEIADAKAPE